MNFKVIGCEKEIRYQFVLIKRVSLVSKGIMAEVREVPEPKPKAKSVQHSRKAKIILSVHRTRGLIQSVAPPKIPRISTDAPVVIAAGAEKFVDILIQGAKGCAAYNGRVRIKDSDVVTFIRNDVQLANLVFSFADIHVANDPGVMLLLDPINRQKYNLYMERKRTKIHERIKKKQQSLRDKKHAAKPSLKRPSKKAPQSSKSDKKRVVVKSIKSEPQQQHQEKVAPSKKNVVKSTKSQAVPVSKKNPPVKREVNVKKEAVKARSK